MTEDQTPAQKRISLIKLLAEASLSVEKANAQLTASGYAVLTDLEIQQHFAVITAQDILDAAQNPDAAAADDLAEIKKHQKALSDSVAKAKGKVDAEFEKNPAAPFTIPGVGSVVHPSLAAVVGKTPSGAEVHAIEAIANKMCHNVVDTLRTALGDPWYAKYAAIKRPGGEGTETMASRAAAYAFAFETLLKIKLNVLFPA